jgi:hypothetical protein
VANLNTHVFVKNRVLLYFLTQKQPRLDEWIDTWFVLPVFLVWIGDVKSSTEDEDGSCHRCHDWMSYTSFKKGITKFDYYTFSYQSKLSLWTWDRTHVRGMWDLDVHHYIDQEACLLYLILALSDSSNVLLCKKGSEQVLNTVFVFRLRPIFVPKKLFLTYQSYGKNGSVRFTVLFPKTQYTSYVGLFLD